MSTILEDFGAFVVPTLMTLHGAFVDPLSVERDNRS